MSRFLAATLCVAASATLWEPGRAHAETLADALNDAYSGNATIQAERFRQRATDEQLPQAQSGWHPSVTLTGSIFRSHQFFGLTLANLGPVQYDTPRSAILSIDQPIYRGGGVEADIARAQATIEAGAADLDMIEQQQLLAAATAYLDVFRDEGVVRLNDNLVQVLSVNRHDVQSTYDAGAATETDTSQASSRLVGADAGQAGAAARLATSRAEFREVVGRDPGDLAPPELLGQLPATEADAAALALAHNPALLAARRQLEAAQHQVDVVRADLLPRVDGVAQLIHDDDDLLRGVRLNQAQVGVTASVPLYQGGETYAKLRAAKESAAAAERQVTVIQRQIEAEVDSAWNALGAARAQQGQFRAQIGTNDVALRDTEKEVTAGTRTRLDVLNAEQELFASRVNLVAAEHDAFVASFQLEAATGTFTPAALGLETKAYDPTAHLDAVEDKWWGTEPPAAP